MYLRRCPYFRGFWCISVSVALHTHAIEHYKGTFQSIPKYCITSTSIGTASSARVSGVVATGRCPLMEVHCNGVFQ